MYIPSEDIPQKFSARHWRLKRHCYLKYIKKKLLNFIYFTIAIDKKVQLSNYSGSLKTIN